MAPTKTKPSLVKREKKPLKCSQCSKSFRDSYALQTHLRIHTGEKPFKCSHCSKYFRTPYNLKVHVATHSGEKPFQCSQCSKFFRNSRSLKLHLLTHTSERPFKCLQCSKSFSVAQALKVHIRIHTGEKPFDCLQCSKSFSRAFDLKLHIRTHTGDKPFKCPQCPKCYVTSYKLKRHLGTHTEMLTQMFQKTIYPPNSSENGKTTLSDDAIKGLSRQYINGGQRGPEAATAANGDHENSADRPSHHPPLQAILGQDSSSTVTSLGAPAAGLMRNSITKTQRFNPMAPPTGLYGSAPAMANDPNIGHTLFVYNIGAETTEIDLYTLFGPFGAIIKVHIQRDLSTGAEKDLGVVTFGDYNDASLAVQAMNGYPCEKNALKPLQVFFKTNKSK
jgi:DNA-directed RNA polymerase subunit RPC12/RpoP